MRVRRSFLTRGALVGTALVLSLLFFQLAPALALAALAARDLSGAPRAIPTTMGALEAGPATEVAAPTGLSLTVERLSD